MSHRPKNPPKFMKDFRIKKTIQAPPQPRGLTLSSWKLYNYSLKIIESGNYEELKHLIDAIKVLIKTIMKVRVDKEISVDIELFKKINNMKIENKVGNEFIIDFPVPNFNEKTWIGIEKALIPKSDSYIFTQESFDILIWIYQNIMLTEYGQKREKIIQEYEEKIRKNKSESELQRLKREQIIEINKNKDRDLFVWIDGMNDFMVNLKENIVPPKEILTDKDIKLMVVWSTILLRPCNLNWGIYNKFAILIDDTIKYPIEMYIDSITELRNNNSYNEILSYMFIRLIEQMISYWYNTKYERSIHEYDLKHIYEDAFNLVVQHFDFERSVRVDINKISPVNYFIRSNIMKTYPQDIVWKQLCSSISNFPHVEQTKLVIDLKIPKDFVIEELDKNKSSSENYHKSLGLLVIYGILDIEDAIKLCTKEKFYFDMLIYIGQEGIDNHKFHDRIKEIKEPMLEVINSLTIMTGYQRYLIGDYKDKLENEFNE